MKKKVLVIDDDPELGKLIEAVLKTLEFSVYQAFSGEEGLKQAYALHPDLFILDIMMPDMDGFDVCRRLREMTNIPILMLTARTHEADMLHGFSVGVDDFVKKPFSAKELEARVRALLRRSTNNGKNNASNITRYKDEILNINLESQSVELNGSMLELSSTEYGLLACLVRNMGKIVPHNQLMHEVWGSSYGNTASTLTIYIFYLRKKLEDAQHGHQYIHTQWGRGYWFLPQEV
ncbi:MAG: response regulator transcription factor [Chloroflexi bacterium]|nr:response regulator transcription factor [Chloroflexota bacterium]